MAPKRKINAKHPKKSKLKLSTKRVAKKRVKDGLLSKNERKESGAARSKPHRGRSPQRLKPNGNASSSPATKPGRPSRFDSTEEAWLRNVPKQLRQYAFKPGNQVAKGHGRPKGAVSLTARLRGILCMPIEGREKEKGKPAITYADELMAFAVQAARRGDYRFFQHIYERIDGKVPDHVVIEEIQQMVSQESEKVTEEVLKVVGDVVLKEFGEKRAAVFHEKLGAELTEALGEKDAGRRAG